MVFRFSKKFVKKTVLCNHLSLRARRMAFVSFGTNRKARAAEIFAKPSASNCGFCLYVSSTECLTWHISSIESGMRFFLTFF